MTTLREYAETLMRLEEAAQLRNDSRFTPDWVEMLLGKYRISAMNLWLRNNKQAKAMGYGNFAIPDSWFQRSEITIIEANQNKQWCYLEMEMPAIPVRFEDGTDGWRFVGEDVLGRSFRKIKTPEYASMLIKSGRLQASNEISYVYTGQKKIKVYGNKLLEQFLVDAVYEDPTELSTFNSDTDNYPISPDILPIVMNLIRNDLHYMGNKPEKLDINRNDNTITR